MPSRKATALRDDTSHHLAGRDGRLSSLDVLAVARVRGARCGIRQGPSLEGWQGVFQQAVSRRYFDHAHPSCSRYASLHHVSTAEQRIKWAESCHRPAQNM